MKDTQNTNIKSPATAPSKSSGNKQGGFSTSKTDRTGTDTGRDQGQRQGGQGVNRGNPDRK